MVMDGVPRTLSANEAACVTGVPLRQVHRVIDAGVLGRAAGRREGSRAVDYNGLVSLKLVHETMAIFTVDGRRRLVRYLLGHPEAETVRLRDVSVDVRSMKDGVQAGLSRLAQARDAITIDDAVLSGVPCVRGTRIPAHDIAEMLANGDEVSAIRDAWPALTEEQIEAAALYARAYPRRGRPRSAPFWRSHQPVVSEETALAELPAAQ
jgi:uncharacterized protein (DUF433 family)